MVPAKSIILLQAAALSFWIDKHAGRWLFPPKHQLFNKVTLINRQQSTFAINFLSNIGIDRAGIRPR